MAPGYARAPTPASERRLEDGARVGLGDRRGGWRLTLGFDSAWRATAVDVVVVDAAVGQARRQAEPAHAAPSTAPAGSVGVAQGRADLLELGAGRPRG